jgi:hypothetical protein
MYIGFPSCSITLVKTPETCRPVLSSIVPNAPEVISFSIPDKPQFSMPFYWQILLKPDLDKQN